MVDLVVLQSLSYTAGAISVVLGVIYYAINLRETTKNRKVTLTSNMLSNINSEEGFKNWLNLMNMQWTDFKDFRRKYDSSVNPENFAKRMAYWTACDHVGWQLKTGLVDLKTIVYAGGGNLSFMWSKFKPVIEEYRKIEYGDYAYSNWGYLAEEIEKYNAIIDTEFRRKRETRLATMKKDGNTQAR
jgi:hypothetical protein